MRQALLQTGETALAQGDAAAAVAAFDRAAAMLHAADAEMGLVRAWMQQGEYRRALAFAAHVAGAHRDAPPATALYVWLLAVGGQEVHARRLLDEARARTPGNAVLALLAQQLGAAGTVVASPTLLQAPHRLAPYGVAPTDGLPLPPSARVVAGGVLLPGGLQALLPAGPWTADGASPLWLRDGLGRTVAARVGHRLEGAGLTMVRLGQPLDAAATVAAPHDPFAGSIGHVVAFAPAPDAAPAWPWMASGFVGAGTATRERRLGVDVPAWVHGAPVFDAAGRWSGVAPRGADGRHVLIAVGRLRNDAPGMPDPLRSSLMGTPAGLPPDAVYERALRVALQVIAAPLDADEWPSARAEPAAR